MALKIVIKDESEENEEYPCAKCGAEMDMEDNYCSSCGAKSTKKSMSVSAAARMKAMSSMLKQEGDK